MGVSMLGLLRQQLTKSVLPVALQMQGMKAH
jgi:hypothetical protein